MPDWIDQERERRARGEHRPLLQSEHAAVNARYPGCTLEYCAACGQPTGGAGKGEGSLYCEDCDAGPFCWECSQDHACPTTAERGQPDDIDLLDDVLPI